jgi:hypothetical protein
MPTNLLLMVGHFSTMLELIETLVLKYSVICISQESWEDTRAMTVIEY